jgi:hypothetical protein
MDALRRKLRNVHNTMARNTMMPIAAPHS